MSEVLLFVHVTCAVLWVGGAHLLVMLAPRVLRSGDPSRVAGFAADAAALGRRLFPPLAFVLLVSGLWLVQRDGWSMADSWISVGFLALILALAAELALALPAYARVAELVPTSGLDAPEVRAAIGRATTVARVELVILLVAIFAMTTKLFA